MNARQKSASILLALACLSSASGCAAIKATQQPPKRNMAVLDSGVPRTHVIAELGAPAWSEQRAGETIDVFTFKQGYSKTTKAARALAHGAADVATLGLWEVVGIPVETIADGTDVQVEVHYGPDHTVAKVAVIKGEDAVHPKGLFARKSRRPQPAEGVPSAVVAAPPANAPGTPLAIGVPGPLPPEVATASAKTLSR